MSKNIYKLFYDSQIDIVKIILPIGFDSQNIGRGYAHLIEHLIIRNNYDILGKIEFSGGWFNGTTRENNTEIVIYSVSNDYGSTTIDELVKSIELYKFNLTKKDFEDEIEVIKKEYKTLMMNNSQHDINQRIGDLSQICKFGIDEANSILEKVHEKIKIIMFSKRYIKSNSSFRCFDIQVLDANKDYIIKGNNKYSYAKLKLISSVLFDEGYVDGIKILNDGLYVEKNTYKNITANLKNIANRLKILVSLSFSKYNLYFDIDDEEKKFDFDFYELWREISAKEKSLR